MSDQTAQLTSSTAKGSVLSPLLRLHLDKVTVPSWMSSLSPDALNKESVVTPGIDRTVPASLVRLAGRVIDELVPVGISFLPQCPTLCL